MKKTIKNTLVFALILALFASCSKYEDGPCISFRSSGNRLNGSYSIKAFIKNGSDHTDYYLDSCGCRFVFSYSRCYSCGDDDPSNPCEGTNGMFTIICPNNPYNYCNSYDSLFNAITYNFSHYCFDFSNGDDGIDLYLGGTDTSDCRLGMYPINISSEKHYFEIRRLTKDELWLQFEDGVNTYLIKMIE